MISSTYKVLRGYKNLFNFEDFLNIGAKSTVSAVKFWDIFRVPNFRGLVLEAQRELDKKFGHF